VCKRRRPQRYRAATAFTAIARWAKILPPSKFLRSFA
jgi:hypothetical protein